MMNYEIFKEVVKEKFMDYMPDSFKGMELIVRPAEKVNMTYDAINIRGEDTTIYCRDISIKIRSHLETKRQNGEFVGNYCVYG